MATPRIRSVVSAAALTMVCATAGARGSDAQVRDALAEAINALKASQESQRRCDEARAALQAMDVGGMATSAALDSAVAQFDAAEARCAQANDAQGRLQAARQALKSVKGEEVAPPAQVLARAQPPAPVAAAPLMPASADEIDTARAMVRLRAYGVSEVELDASSPKQVRLALSYLDFLERQPDARGTVGGSTVTFSAGEAGTEAALKLALKTPHNPVFSDGSLILTAPLANGAASFYGNTDSLRKSLALALAANFHMPNSLGSDANGASLLYRLGVNARVQDVNYNYFAGNGPWTTAAEKHRPWSAGLHAVGAIAKQQDADTDIGTWQFNLDRKTTWTAAPGQTRCPLPGAGSTSLLCQTGAFSPPAQAKLWSLAGEYRREFGRTGIAPKLSLGWRQDVKQERVELPFYFIPSAAADGTPDYSKLRAGISYTWDRTRNTSAAAPSQSIDRLFSVFFSSPLDSFRLP